MALLQLTGVKRTCLLERVAKNFPQPAGANIGPLENAAGRFFRTRPRPMSNFSPPTMAAALEAGADASVWARATRAGVK
jgi:hypothetical protein